jgi:hypothetical protein
MTNWLPTVGGLLTAIGMYMLSVPGWEKWGGLLGAAGAFFTGLVSKQFNVTGGSKPASVEATNRADSPTV